MSPRLTALLLGMAAFAPTLSALAGLGDLGGTKPGDLAFPAFADADTCALCHGGGVQGDTSFLPSDTWAGTMMANATRDPSFVAALAIANQDAPDVGSYCLRCHSPIGFVRGHTTPSDGTAFDAVDRQGVGCETCHRATQSSPPAGGYLLSDAQLVFTESKAKHGPYASSASPAHMSVEDHGLEDARFCGQCHLVTNPERNLRDGNGADTGLAFPLDTTFTEWSQSRYAKLGDPGARSCIECHMPSKDGEHPVASTAGAPLRTSPRDHGFVGGNHFGILAVEQTNPERYAALKGAFDLAAERTIANVASAVKVTIVDAPSVVKAKDTLDVRVRVDNHTGHKFPTGYAESRRAWVALVLVDNAASERFLAGAYDVETGAVSPSPATHIYRAVQGHWDGSKAVADEHLVLHDVVLSDTRIPPEGFTPDATTHPSSEVAYADGLGGYNAFDDATLHVSLPDDAHGTYSLEARVYYQAMTKQHVDFLREANTTNDAGERLSQAWEAVGRSAPLIAGKAAVAITIADAASTTSASSGGGSSASAGREGSASSVGGHDNADAQRPSDSGCGCSMIDDRASNALALSLTIALAASCTRRRRHRWISGRETLRRGAGALRTGSERWSRRDR